MPQVRVGALTVRQGRKVYRTPSGLLRPEVFRGDGVGDYEDQARLRKRGLDLERSGRLLSALTFHYEIEDPNEVTAREHAKACEELDRGPAGHRARELLFKHLTPNQQDMAARYGYFDLWLLDKGLIAVCLNWGLTVNLNPVMFRIHRGFPNGNVVMGFPENAYRMQLCAHPTTPYPTDDICLAQLLMLQTDPDEFIRIANIYPTYPAVRRLFTDWEAKTKRSVLLPFLKQTG